VLGCEHTLKFPTVKLLEFAGAERELLANENPFALVTLAHLLTKSTRKVDARYAAKWKLVQLLYQRDWDKQRIIDLFLVLDWMMRLPEHLKQELCHNIELLEESEKMRYVSSVEQVLIERVMQQGMQQGEKKGETLALQRLLTKRFGGISPDMTARIAESSVEQIEAWFVWPLTQNKSKMFLGALRTNKTALS
jgi:hypothetical protein